MLLFIIIIFFYLAGGDWAQGVTDSFLDIQFVTNQKFSKLSYIFYLCLWISISRISKVEMLEVGFQKQRKTLWNFRLLLSTLLIHALQQ